MFLTPLGLQTSPFRSSQVEPADGAADKDNRPKKLFRCSLVDSEDVQENFHHEEADKCAKATKK
jgi:hypothetical protein